jgi:hypothetical protein
MTGTRYLSSPPFPFLLFMLMLMLILMLILMLMLTLDLYYCLYFYLLHLPFYLSLPLSLPIPLPYDAALQSCAIDDNAALHRGDHMMCNSIRSCGVCTLVFFFSSFFFSFLLCFSCSLPFISPTLSQVSIFLSLHFFLLDILKFFPSILRESF